ncbi:hypothetical protein PRIPAC_88171 [Pristionchus pacificus]|uniref:Major sperm protein n=1 Tax=Pristionchus pacificus TaxID=54126 RepID=A0A2A6B7L2_PRIPA|nr:hypothetical protein PRIPAC_88171 [Pristionchus pacificus]|eukprot:PDM61854.1 MSP domain-containing protein [Pristionchus pacificus]
MVLSQPTEYRITIANGSTKFAAYQVLSTDSAIFSACPAHGIVCPGEKQKVQLQYANQQEQTEQHHFRVYIAVSDSYSLPGDFLTDAPSTEAHGVQLLAVDFSPRPPPTRFDIRPIPENVEIAPETVTFCCGSVGTRAMQCIMISNRSEKHATYKVISSLRTVFHVQESTGMVHSGTSKPLTVTFKNKEEPPGNCFFFIFISLAGGRKLPEYYGKGKTGPPTEYDGCKALPICISREGTTVDTPTQTAVVVDGTTSSDVTLNATTETAPFDLQFDAYSLRGRQKKEQDESKDSKESTSISNYVPLYEGDGQEVKLTKDVVFTEPENGPLIYECGSNPPKKPLDGPLTLMNKSTKFAAFKFWSTDQTLFRPEPPCGIIPAGGTQNINVVYVNEKVRECFKTPYFNTEGLFPMKELSKEIDIKCKNSNKVETKDTINFICKTNVAEPAYSYMVINNKHTEKKLAYKVFTRDKTIFKVHNRAGVILPGKYAIVTCKFTNQKEEKDLHAIHIFTNFIDTETLPDDFKAGWRIPPYVYDGARAFKVEFTKDTSIGPTPTKKTPSAEKIRSTDKTDGGPPSQTGGATVTEADGGAAAPSPAAAAAAPAAPSTNAA